MNASEETRHWKDEDRAVQRAYGEETICKGKREIPDLVVMSETQPLRKIAAWKKCRCLNSEIQALVDDGLLQEKVLVNWNCAGGDPYPMEKTRGKF